MNRWRFVVAGAAGLLCLLSGATVAQAVDSFDSDVMNKVQEKINRDVPCTSDLDGTCTPVSSTNPMPSKISDGGTTADVTAAGALKVDGSAVNQPTIPGPPAGAYSSDNTVADGTADSDVNTGHTIKWATICADREVGITLDSGTEFIVLGGECHEIQNVPTFVHVHIDTTHSSSTSAARVRILHAGYDS